MKKRGRPPKEVTKSKCFRVRLEPDEYEKLKFTSDILGISECDVMRNGLNTMLRIAKYREREQENE